MGCFKTNPEVKYSRIEKNVPLFDIDFTMIPSHESLCGITGTYFIIGFGAQNEIL